MLKLFFATFTGILLLVCGVVIFYWRDIQYDPSAADLLNYLLLLPFIICLAVCSPVFIYRFLQVKKERKAQQEQAEAEQMRQAEAEKQQIKPAEIQWLHLNVYSSSAYSALGENETILEGIHAFQSPELDTELQNIYGLPMLSYRIQALDTMLPSPDENTFDSMERPRHLRMQALIEHQLEQHAEILWKIAQHLKQSALFYDSELAYEYRMHPAWIDPNSEYDEDASEDQVNTQQIPKLNHIQVHILLSESVLHVWNEAQSFEIVQQYLNDLGIITAQIHIEHHYFSQETAYKDWMQLLEQVSVQSEEISFVVNVDSEIDQEVLDEKTWLSDRYLPSEYASSWCLAASSLQLLDTTPLKKLDIALNESSISNQLAARQWQDLEQFKAVQPFVLMLDDLTDIQTIKKVNQTFKQSRIEDHHFIQTQQSLGDTQHLAKVFGFMLSMHLPDELMAMVYSADQLSTHCFMQSYEDINENLEQSI